MSSTASSSSIVVSPDWIRSKRSQDLFLVAFMISGSKLCETMDCADFHASRSSLFRDGKP